MWNMRGVISWFRLIWSLRRDKASPFGTIFGKLFILLTCSSACPFCSCDLETISSLPLWRAFQPLKSTSEMRSVKAFGGAWGTSTTLYLTRANALILLLSVDVVWFSQIRTQGEYSWLKRVGVNVANSIMHFNQHRVFTAVSPSFSISSDIREASRASPSITGQMGWAEPAMVKPACVILFLNLIGQQREKIITVSILQDSIINTAGRGLCSCPLGTTESHTSDIKGKK